MPSRDQPIPLASDRDPWDRQPGESERQYSRFRAYLELGRTRTLKQAHETLSALGVKVSLGQLYNVSWIYQWADRAQSFDADQDRLHREQLFAARKDMIDRHQKVARSLQGKALTRLKQLPVEELSALDVVRMLRLAVAIEHKAIGEPDQRVAVTGGDGGPVVIDDLSQYSGEERRRRLEQLAAELARRAGSMPAADGPDELEIED